MKYEPGTTQGMLDPERVVRRAIRELWRDERAIEGLPVRLVIAVVVGVASLGVMLSLIEGVGTVGVTELDVRADPAVMEPGEQRVSLTVIDPEGRPVAGATVVVTGDTAETDGVRTATTDADGTATVAIEPTLPPNRVEGELRIEIKPPAGSQYVDRRGNTRLLIVRDG